MKGGRGGFLSLSYPSIHSHGIAFHVYIIIGCICRFHPGYYNEVHRPMSLSNISKKIKVFYRDSRYRRFQL